MSARVERGINLWRIYDELDWFLGLDPDGGRPSLCNLVLRVRRGHARNGPSYLPLEDLGKVSLKPYRSSFASSDLLCSSTEAQEQAHEHCIDRMIWLHPLPSLLVSLHGGSGIN